MNQLFFAALLAGLTGGLHCVGMCGPFPATTGPLWHAGRIVAYVAFGAAAGLSGRALPSAPWTGALAALVLGWSCLRFGGFIHASEANAPWLRAGARWLRGFPRPVAAVGFGALAALLPCGLLWAALGLATAARSATGGAEVMAAFALGTLPALAFAGALVRRLVGSARRGAAVFMFAVGLFAILHRAGAISFAGDGVICDHAGG